MRWTACTANWSADFGGTKRIDGRLTASQIASASFRSFLLDFTYGFHELRADQPNLVPKCREHSCPVMRAVRGFHTDQARRQVSKERGDGLSTQPFAQDDFAVNVDAVNFKDIFRKIEILSEQLT